MRGKGSQLLPPLALALLLGGCAVLDHGFVNAAGPVAAHERALFRVAGIILVFVAAPVLLLVPVFAWHYRLSNTRHAYRPHWGFSWWLEGLIWIPPLGIVIALAALLWHWTQIDDPYRPLPGGAPVEVQVVGLDWKWLFIYPEQGIATVNQLAMPVGRPVHLRLTSGTVMQSFMVPQLAGQIYAMNGMTTQLNIAAGRPGRYPGRNTQYSGTGFPQQRFEVVALPPDAYARWIARVERAPQALDAATWARLQQRTVSPQPQFFGTVSPRLFERIVAGAPHPHPEPRP